MRDEPQRFLRPSRLPFRHLPNCFDYTFKLRFFASRGDTRDLRFASRLPFRHLGIQDCILLVIPSEVEESFILSFPQKRESIQIDSGSEAGMTL